MNMGLQLQDIRNLVDVARGDDEVLADMARTDLLVEIAEEHMGRHLYKYTDKNTVGGLDRDDMEQIFLIACSEAIDTVDTGIGNPLLYILQKGKWAVVDELRKGYRKSIRQYCHECGTETRLYERNGEIICPSCGNTNDRIDRVQVDITDDGTLTDLVMDEREDIGEAVASSMVVAEFRERLTGRKADVFDMIMGRGIDRGASKNYIKEVAEELGITPTNVNLRLRQIKKDWQEYEAEMAEDNIILR